MGKGMKNGHEQHKEVMKGIAKNRVDDLQGMLQGMFCDLQSARKQICSSVVALLEEQVNLMLKEWQSELNHRSPASSFQGGGSLGSFSTEIGRLLQLCEEEDDATSGLPAPKPEPDMQKVCSNVVLQQVMLEKRAFLSEESGSKSTFYYSFDGDDIHFVILGAYTAYDKSGKSIHE